MKKNYTKKVKYNRNIPYIEENGKIIYGVYNGDTLNFMINEYIYWGKIKNSGNIKLFLRKGSIPKNIVKKIITAG